MSLFLLALKTVSPLFLAIAIGILFTRIIKVNSTKWTDILNDYALWIGFPALIFVALSRTTFDFGRFGPLITSNSLYIIISIFLAFPLSALFKVNQQTKRTLFLALAFSNVSYLGIPIIRNTYGDAVLPELTIISAVYLFWLFTLCIFLVEYFGPEKPNLLKQLRSFTTNPMLISVALGIFFSVFKIQVPHIIIQTLDLFADSVTAVVLFSLGIFLGSHPLGKLREWIPVAGFSLVTLIVLPGLFYWSVAPFLPTNDFKVWILEAAMPMGLTPYALSVKYKLNTIFASKIVILSTILSVLSLPLWILFFQ